MNTTKGKHKHEAPERQPEPHCSMKSAAIAGLPVPYAEQFAFGVGGVVKDEGQVTNKRHAIRSRAQHPEGIALDERRETLRICFFEMFGYVHG